MAGDSSTDEPPTTTILLNGYDLNSYLFTHRLAQHSDLGGEVSLCGEWKSMYKLATGNKGQWSAQQQMGHLCQALPSQAQEPLQREGRVLVQDVRDSWSVSWTRLSGTHNSCYCLCTTKPVNMLAR